MHISRIVFFMIHHSFPHRDQCHRFLGVISIQVLLPGVACMISYSLARFLNAKGADEFQYIQIAQQGGEYFIQCVSFENSQQ